MNQTKLGSLIESIVNVLIGYWIGVASQMIIFPLFGFDVTIAQNMIMGLWFTVISIGRSYAIRRWFNARLHNMSLKLAEKYES